MILEGMTSPKIEAEPKRAAPAAPAEGFHLYPNVLCGLEQSALVREVLAVVQEAPFYDPVTPGGKPMSVQMTNLGPLGWITDAQGYRYEPVHPVTSRPWPPIPSGLLRLWDRLARAPGPPDACLVNLYRGPAKMGLHQDRDEADFAFPVLSVSLGDTAIFRIGGRRRADPTRTVRLGSGDVCVLSDQSRLAYHGIERVIAGSSRLIPGGGRLNLTLRRAAPA